MQSNDAVFGTFRTCCCCVLAVGVEGPVKCLATFADAFDQGAFQDAQPIAVGQHFVVCVNHCNRVFEVQNGRKGCFQNDVTDTCRIGLTNTGGAVDLNVDMQTVIDEQYCAWSGSVALVAYKLVAVCQSGDCAILECCR